MQNLLTFVVDGGISWFALAFTSTARLGRLPSTGNKDDEMIVSDDFICASLEY